MTEMAYRTEWQTYAYPEDNIMSGTEDIIGRFTRTDLASERYPKGGIPLFAQGDTVYLNGENENTIIFGETGSKKTRAAILPLIATTAGARESAFITDVKGELSANKKLHNYLEALGIRTVCLDFRSFSGDGYNILEKPYRLFCQGEKDKAASIVRRLVNSFSHRYENFSGDPFWSQSAEQYLVPMIELIFAHCSVTRGGDSLVNMLSVNALSGQDGADAVGYALKNGYLYDILDDNSLIMLRGVLGNPEKTLSCIMGTVQSMIKDFTIQRSLMNMLSYTTFDVAGMYEQPTFVFLIVPDETSTYDTISGMLLDIFYNELIETYNLKYQNDHESACRINFICDEFCNLKINDMRSKISASRSRNMRWFLVCQSEKQLNSVYPTDSGTIIGNCKNILFLQSSDPDLLDYMSSLCGKSSIGEEHWERPLVTRRMLKEMKIDRDYKEALFIRDDIRYFAKLKDIDAYDFLRKYDEDGAYTFEKRVTNDMSVLMPFALRDAAERRIISHCGSDEPYEDDCWFSEPDDDCEEPSDGQGDNVRFEDTAYYDPDDSDEDDDDHIVTASGNDVPGYVDADCGSLTDEDIEQTDNSDILPGEADETVKRRLKSLFGTGAGDNAGEE